MANKLKRPKGAMVWLGLLMAQLEMVGYADSDCLLRHVDVPPTPLVARAAFDIILPRNPKGVLVLVPGANGEGGSFLSETNWVRFAERKRWAIAAATFVSHETLLKKGSGYYDVKAGSGNMLLSAIKETGLGAQPLYIYGFSGGARFAAGFAMAYPSCVAGWAALAPSDAVAIRGGGNPPGIVACGANDGRLGASLSWFKGLRRAGRHVTWVEIPGVAHVRCMAFERFVRDWFSEVDVYRGGSEQGVWVDLGNGALIDGETSCSQTNRSWLPSRAAYMSWRGLVVDDSLPVVSRQVFTQADRCPRLTMFLRRPSGVVSNVLCLSMLANSPVEVEWRLRCRNRHGTIGTFLNFADSNRLAVVAWGAPRRLWKPRYNWDGIGRQENMSLSRAFDHVAKGWEKAMDGFAKKHGIPTDGYLMVGFSGAAQFAQRLALHCPDRFGAVAIHIASSYDYPLPAGGRIVWCVTTGENESGYERSLLFLKAAKANGYSVIYKAYPGLGHQDSALASRLACACFGYLLAIDDSRRLDSKVWPFVADVVNQSCYVRARESEVPSAFRSYLPCEKVAAAWKRQ